VKPKASAVVPNTRCPFTGDELVVVEAPCGNLGQQMFQAQGRFWRSRWYNTKRELLYDLSTRDGNPPGFTAVEPSALQGARLRESPPPDPRQGLGASGARAAEVIEAVLGT
jgi:hypothetical protein